MTLSTHQRLALTTLADGPRTIADLATALEIHPNEMVKLARVLADRGLVRITGEHGAYRQVPRRHTCELTERGRVVAKECAA